MKKKKQWVKPRIILFSDSQHINSGSKKFFNEQIKFGADIGCTATILAPATGSTVVFMYQSTDCNCSSPSTGTLNKVTLNGMSSIPMGSTALCNVS